MPGDVSVEFGDVLRYGEEKFREFFGKDYKSLEFKKLLDRRVLKSLKKASFVQCIGMEKPIPLEKLYQPVLLNESLYSETTKPLKPLDIVKNGESGAIFGSPGSGKTILMHWALLSLTKEKGVFPILFTLREEGCLGELQTLVSEIEKLKPGKRRVAILVDGYDEISFDSRKVVSSILSTIDALKNVCYLLTCRRYYDLIDLSVRRYYIAPFGVQNAEKYMEVFLSEYGSKCDAKSLVNELLERGLKDFLDSPLMIALICILKTGPMPYLPNQITHLMGSAIETLSMKWDLSRGVTRQTRIELSGRERVQCLKRVAFSTRTQEVPESVVLSSIKKHMVLIQRQDIDAQSILLEMAKWYGILVPAIYEQWIFVHRALMDYLAAQFWVETGQFIPKKSGKYKDVARVAYAACLIPDATEVLFKLLNEGTGMYVLMECILNRAPFQVNRVAAAVIQYYEKRPSLVCSQASLDQQIGYESKKREIRIALPDDFFQHASDDFLLALYISGSVNTKKGHTIVYCMALTELLRRGKRPKGHNRDDLKGIEAFIHRPNLGDFRVGL